MRHLAKQRDASFFVLFFKTCQYGVLTLILSFALIGIGWISMNSIPFALLTTALAGKHEGAYLGLFNCSICLPQIIASVASFAIFPLIGKSMPGMLLLAGIVFASGALFVGRIQEQPNA